jgi:PQQ-dependent dehydrogenase (methanol/ethanol family)
MIRLLPFLIAGCIVGALLAQRPPRDPVAFSGLVSPGEELFVGKGGCVTCHRWNGDGGVVGPDLASAAVLPTDVLRNKILDPNTNANPGGRGGPSSILVRTKSGQEIRGIRRAEDTFTLLITDATGAIRRFDKRDLASAEVQQKSLMPADFAQRLSESEINDLVTYIKTQNGGGFTKFVLRAQNSGVSFDRLIDAAAEPQNWLTYWGDYQGRHYSALKQIDTSNVRELQARWAVQLPNNSLLEATPIVVDGIMYTSGAPGQVLALDAKTGLQIWRYQRQQKVVNPSEINRYSRGVSILGNRLFLGTLDAALVALDARNGQLVWETQVADTMLGYSITSPPLAVNDKIITGVGGGEFGANGMIAAFDPATGKRLWHFNTIPGPDEFGHETWKGESCQHGGGPAWLTGSYDPESDTLYWTVGNPGPDYDANVRAGDNLFTCSVIALDPNTGRRKWHYQFTPNDSHDWDSTEDVILVDRMFQGQPRKLLLHADRNGMFYVLDRTDGKLLLGKPFVRQTWNTGFDANGRPKIVPNTDSQPEGSIPVYPSAGGGTNWQAPSYSPDTGWLYLMTGDSGQRYIRRPSEYQAGKQYGGGGGRGLGEPAIAAIKALDPETGDVKWTYPVSRGSLAAGVLATGGGVVFAATPEGNLIALNARTGAPLWRVQTGATIAASPMSYSVDGKQFIAISAGAVLYSFALPE